MPSDAMHPGHEHAPLEQTSPFVHAPPVVPQVHAPAEHVSVVPLQVAHAAPPVPQSSTLVPSRHAPPAAVHPPQPHDPPEQVSPFAHALPVAPQVHTPVEHVSVVPLQVAHVSPPVPHSPALVPATQRPLLSTQPVHLQLPPEQVNPSVHAAPVVPQVQAPSAVHVSPVVPHDVHVAPSVPQWVGDGVWQTPLAEQHPSGHEVELQTHVPWAEQTCPVGQAPPVVPHSQSPPVQALALALQALHVWPFVPQADVDVAVTHAPAIVQHPSGHELELQMHAWFEQTCPAAHAAD
jgi:hypothetical protein